MTRRFLLGWLAVVAILLAFPERSPAPLVYRPGEGWTYESVEGGGSWRRTRAKDQLAVADAAFGLQDYSLALKAAKHVVKEWPLSDYAAPAQFMVARCYEARKKDERAFKEYQKLLQKYPASTNIDTSLLREFEIANRFLAGQWFKLWGVIPFFPSMDKTAELYQQIVNNGPYSPVGPDSQMKIGAAREKQKNWEMAAKAYETAIFRYIDRPKVAANAFYQSGQAYEKQSLRAEYDQSAAGKAITAFSDFNTLYPTDDRVAIAKKAIVQLKAEQARGSYQTARYYEKHHKWQGALIYFNNVLQIHAESPYAAEARQRIEEIKQKIQATPPSPAKPPAK